jgi:hypothetical protein
MRRFWYLIVFCVLTAEYDGITWERHWSTPWRYITDIVFGAVPMVHVPWYDVAVLVLLLTARRGAGPRVKPIETAIWFTIATLLFWAVYGASRAGSVLDMRLQLHVIVLTLLTSLMQTRLLRTREHFVALGKTIVYAALFRFAMMFTFYITVLRSLTVPVATVTDHADSILFVTTIVIVIANVIHKRSRKTKWQAIVVTALMIWCIQINNRRLAYVSLVASIIIIVSLLWTREFRRKLLRYVVIVAPILLVYVSIGWSRPTGIFKPVASLQSVSDPNDKSTQSRIVEDMGLIVTLQDNPLFGTGFGQKYTEVSTAFSTGFAESFPQYRYIPHNSVLGLIAFTGLIGFTGIWMIFPITAYFAARSYAFAKHHIDKTVSMIALCEVIIHTNQMWGDIGILAPQGLVLISAGIAAASRFAILTGAWPAHVPRPRRARQPAPVRADSAE